MFTNIATWVNKQMIKWKKYSFIHEKLYLSKEYRIIVYNYNNCRVEYIKGKLIVLPTEIKILCNWFNNWKLLCLIYGMNDEWV